MRVHLLQQLVLLEEQLAEQLSYNIVHFCWRFFELNLNNTLLLRLTLLLFFPPSIRRQLQFLLLLRVLLLPLQNFQNLDLSHLLHLLLTVLESSPPSLVKAISFDERWSAIKNKNWFDADFH